MTEVMTPESEEELAALIRDAKAPFRIEGGGTRPIGATSAEMVLSTRGLSGIELYEPGALTIVARAGTPLAQIEAALAAENQMLPFEPMDHRGLLGTAGEPTIGGVMAANVSGPRRVTAGACRDLAIGVRFVDGAGNIVKNGGRVMKNVTGYDLVKLMAGSWGTLGVLTEVAFKVLPKPETSATVTLTGLSLDRASAAMAAALGSPFGVSGAAHLIEGEGQTLIRVEGATASVAYRADRLRTHLGTFGNGEILENDPVWTAIRDAGPMADKSAVWRVSVKPSEAATMLDSAIWQTMDCDAMLDWGGGLVWIGADDAQLARNADWDGSGRTDPATGVETLHTVLQDYCRLIGGHATLVKASLDLRARLPVFQPEVETLRRMAAALRAKFDPRGILNPGAMG